jgi:hypothetical protein
MIGRAAVGFARARSSGYTLNELFERPRQSRLDPDKTNAESAGLASTRVVGRNGVAR